MIHGEETLKLKKEICSFEYLKKKIQDNKMSIVFFGAGAIGQIVIPQILLSYEITDFIDCYIDNDSSKWNTTINVLNKQIEIKSPEYLKKCDENTVIFINISRYAEVIEQLEQMECTQNMTAFIMPMLLIDNFCSDISKGKPIMTSNPIIPKKIHYIWLGKKEIPYNLRRCIDTWIEKCPDYEIIRWDESNYDFGKHPYMRQAYESGAYGFAPDYARIDILYREGGFYFDTDVEIKQSLDELRYQEAFCATEKWQILNFGGGSGAVKGHPMIKRFLDARESTMFLDENGKQNRNTCGFYDTQTALAAGYEITGKTQNIGGMNIYAYDYFHPYDYMSGLTNETNHTISIHYFNGGWLDDKMKEQNRLAIEKYQDIYKKCLKKSI